ncbi:MULTISPECIES: DUF6003 family protein [Streptomyces]|jgi:hypothetical protein|uniref:Uncharacterized protein n=3 Tax=Streptomyces griseoaurantiacus TaxID=68213 RepID=F3NGP7_9ACTN|nr:MULTISPECIES: DUF6003 family protein [Streptomyces]EGG47387.1 hypothetical protein SGM_2311 [Streptomyces griseoaurantiacus M045]MBA5223830.1 hypothetical protein [Streptomyces griseoaurantiacus]SDF55767.1 hypothetical protein SAMN05216260_10932 [Streptomyces jietaisiensis]
MTDDAYLVLLDGPAGALGVPLAAVGEPACMATPAVQGWLDAQGVTPSSPRLRLLPPEETAAIPEGAERLPVPLDGEELSLLRHRAAPQDISRLEEELLAYRSHAEGREELLARAAAAGVPAHRIAELTGEDLVAVKASTS